jgi:hypothetical protein
MSFRGAGHKRVYARLRRALAREPGIHNHELAGTRSAGATNKRLRLWIPGSPLRGAPE